MTNKISMKLLIFIILQITIYCEIFSEDNYENKYNISSQKYTIIAFLDPISCIKCKINIDNIINCLNPKLNINKYNVIGFMRVDRKVEFNFYKKHLEWNFSLYPIDRQFMKYYGIKSLMDFVILSPQKKVIYQNNLSEYNDIIPECKKIKNLTKDLE